MPTYICIVGFKYEIRGVYLYFLTHTIVDWIDIFTRRELADIVVDSLDHCIRQKGLELYAWCLMPSHLHMIARSPTRDERELSNIMRDFKKFTSGEIIRTIGRIGESRREWLLKHFKAGPNKYQVWQEGMHPIALFTRRFTEQKLIYIHENPIAAGLVDEEEHYRLSSARDYAGSKKGLLDIVFVE